MNCPSDEVHKALIANILFRKHTTDLVDCAGPDNLGGEDEVGRRPSVQPVISFVRFQLVRLTDPLQTPR